MATFGYGLGWVGNVHRKTWYIIQIRFETVTDRSQQILCQRNSGFPSCAKIGKTGLVSSPKKESKILPKSWQNQLVLSPLRGRCNANPSVDMFILVDFRSGSTQAALRVSSIGRTRLWYSDNQAAMASLKDGTEMSGDQ